MSVSLSTHVLDTAAGRPAAGVTVELLHGADRISSSTTDADGRARLADSLEAGRYRLVFHPPSTFFRRVELELELDDGHYHVPLRLSLLVRELPRQLSVEELAELFEGRTRFVELLATRPDPLDCAPAVIAELTEAEKHEVLAAHPAIGQRSGLSARSAAEQGADADAEVLAELARLNAAYEARHGFRFVVFVDRRPKTVILDVLRLRIDNPTGKELDTALRELVAIATDRWQRG